MLKLKRHQGKMVDRVRQLEAEANTARKVLLTTPHGPPPHSAETGGYCRFLSFDPPPSTPHPQTSTLNSQLSTLNPQPSTLNPQPSTLNPQPSTLNPNRRPGAWCGRRARQRQLWRTRGALRLSALHLSALRLSAIHLGVTPEPYT